MEGAVAELDAELAARSAMDCTSGVDASMAPLTAACPLSKASDHVSGTSSLGGGGGGGGELSHPAEPGYCAQLCSACVLFIALPMAA